MWWLHVRSLSIIRPKNFVFASCLLVTPSITILFKTYLMVILFWGVWKAIKLVFSKLSDNRLDQNQSFNKFQFLIYLLIGLLIKSTLDSWEKKALVSIAKSIILKNVQTLGYRPTIIIIMIKSNQINIRLIRWQITTTDTDAKVV